VASANLTDLLDERVDWRFKGFPPAEGVTFGTVGEQGWNLLAGDLPLPALVLKERALAHNVELVARWCAEHGVLHAPHGKTMMAPQLAERQLAAGAWAVTVAHVAQARVYRAFGVPRIFLANELVEPGSLRWLADELAADPDFDFYCLVDSLAGVELMTGALAGAERPAKVLVEAGFAQGRTGCRSTGEALEVARAAAASPMLELVGVEGYEGLIGGDRSDGSLAAVDAFLRHVRAVALELSRGGLFADRERVLLSAGGSAYFDRVVEHLGGDWLDRPIDLVVRAGGYLTHDEGLYATVSPLAGRLVPALEAWGVVLSRPEAELALVGLGKRDVSHDVHLPLPRLAHGQDGLRSVQELAVTALNDQHAYVRVPAADPLAVGDLLGCGISHPCTAFDKWRLIPVVDDDYTVVDTIATFF
jgi:D-serine deaminase-like pyridoxal phosphate-dependent protein